MLNSSKIIVAITKTKIRVLNVKMDSPIISEKQEEFDWNAETLVEVLHTIKKKYGTLVRVLLGDEFVHVTTVKTDKTQSINRQSAQSLVQGSIPDDLNKTSWDYRVYPDYLQVAVLNKALYEQITDAVKKVEIDIESIETCSSALARLVAAEKEPFILIYQDDVPVIITVQNGVALTSSVIHDTLTASHIEQAVRFSEELFHVTIKKIIKTENIGDIITGDFFKEFIVESKNLEPAVGLAMKTDVKTPDANSLNLEIDSSLVNQHSRLSFVPYLLFFLAFLFTLSGVYFGQQYFTKNKSNTVTDKPEISKTISTVTPLPSPTPVIKMDYTVEILNGSGVSGEAGRLSNILKENKYTVVLTGNAEEADSGIALHYNSRVDKLYLNKLDKLLKTIYTTVVTEPKLASDEADITIIIGTFTKK